MVEIRSDRMAAAGRYGIRTEINKETLAGCDEFQMDVADLPDAGVGHTVRMTAPDGAQKDFLIVKRMRREFLLRAARKEQFR